MLADICCALIREFPDIEYDCKSAAVQFDDDNRKIDGNFYE